MNKIAQGQIVKAKTHGGIVTGEIKMINNKKVTISAEEKIIEENGQSMTVSISEEIVLMDHSITEIIS